MEDGIDLIFVQMNGLYATISGLSTMDMHLKRNGMVKIFNYIEAHGYAMQLQSSDIADIPQTM